MGGEKPNECPVEPTRIKYAADLHTMINPGTMKEVGEKYAEGQERYTFDAAGYSFHVILDDESKGIRQVSIGRGGGKMMIITIGNYGSGLVEITLGKRVVGKVECQKPNVGDVKTMEKITEKFYLIIGRKIDGRETDEAGEY